MGIGRAPKAVALKRLLLVPGDDARQLLNIQRLKQGEMMTHFIQNITAKISALPEPMQQEVFAFVELMHIKAARQAMSSKNDPASNEQARAIQWNHPEEDGEWVTY